ncbi:hypothetical protein Golax_005371 [Gossypium laxum]|uniref:Uncharacterized protein n=1 Tax=Gossypium laxum TaxID=34288 RepID=A0A7J9A0X2_9ROSI|nr:hypothetical protein [Gossypium laxum]
MSGTQVRQAISGINDMRTMMGKVSPNEYPLSEVRVENDLVDDFDGSYVPKESVVLLENGALFLLDLASCVNWLKLNAYVKKTKIEMLNPYAIVDKDQFLAFSRAKADGFQFVLASKSLLLLCDVCKPMVPLLCWAHHLHNPCFIDVIRLSELRSQFRDDTYQWATESGFCIILGLFWNCEFRLFCYSPSSASEGYVAIEISKFCKPFLSRDLSKLLCESDEFDGFILIRLMSLGKIEAQ